MFHSNNQLPTHLPGNSVPTEEPQLPRGECGFILSEAEGSQAPRQRCSCRSFYPDPIVRSRCGCGHQAWNHEAQSLATVSMEDYLQAVEQMKQLRQQVQRFETWEHELKQELFKERLAREELIRTNTAIHARMYGNMQLLKLSLDDRVEAVVDRTTELSDLIKAQGQRLTMVDEFSMELENRVDRVEQLGGRSGDATPVVRMPTPTASPVPQIPLLLQPPQQKRPGQLPIRSDRKCSMLWCVRVIFVPRKSQRLAYDPDSRGYKRCASRNLHQYLDFPSRGSACFTNVIEVSFKSLFRGRPWMPMIGHRPADEPFGRMALTLLPPDLIHRDRWDYLFLDNHCISHDKMQGDVLYITLQYEDVTWNEIRFLPAVSSVDDSCWEFDEELDSTTQYKSLDSEIMYDLQDPPPTYSSRTHSAADRTLSKLDVLADSAAMLSPIDRAPSRSSHRSARSTPISSLQRTSTQASSYSSHLGFSERSSLRSLESETTDDEHRDKKAKLRSKSSMASDNGHVQAQQPMYVSGRSKRKMPVREKGPREPLHFSVTNVAKWRPNLLHPHSSKGKEVAQHP